MDIRKGKVEDLEGALQLIHELAVYEKLPQEVSVTIETMENDFDAYQFFVAEKDNEITGIALYSPYYSTWKGKCLYLEDIVVKESYRRNGIGRLLFNAVVKEAQKLKSKRLMWQVLDWNEPAIIFYKNLNANLDGDWINCKLTEEQIHNFKF